jgi:hypothetical protein
MKPEQKTLAYLMWLDGEKVSQIAQHFKLSTDAMRYHIKHEQARCRGKRPPLPAYAPLERSLFNLRCITHAFYRSAILQSAETVLKDLPEL